VVVMPSNAGIIPLSAITCRNKGANRENHHAGG
jgi:hypothetical protein